MDQTLFNLIFGLASALGGGVLVVIWDELKKLRQEDKAIAERVAAIDVLVAGSYVKRDYFEAKFEALSHGLFAQLNRIEDKLDKKVDKG